MSVTDEFIREMIKAGYRVEYRERFPNGIEIIARCFDEKTQAVHRVVIPHKILYDVPMDDIKDYVNEQIRRLKDK